eukprot:XP_016661132.1 PREDICTED: histone-lysine N-methyltransferase PRDM9-like [Acyrthosiphon pisum]
METSKPSMLSIPLLRSGDGDQVLNTFIKQENVDKNGHNNDESILQICNTWTIEKVVNTTNINLKTEEDIIEGITFYGSAVSEDHSLEIIDRLNSRDNLRENTLTSNTANLTRHSEMEEPLICAMCNQLFYEKSDLIKHILRHTRENTHNNRILCYNCNICGKKFSQAKLFEAHLRLHTKKKPHLCEFFNKGFGTRTDLKVHTRTHTGEKPYYFDICKKGFSQGGNLKRHNEKIH